MTTLFDYQQEALDGMVQQRRPLRACLYYKTGAGKTPTSLAPLQHWAYSEAVVIAPPSTHEAWHQWGLKFGVECETMSHAMFRQAKTRLSRNKPVIADEFHMFGGQGGKGFKKFQTLARHLDAPLVLCSATPNYNDAERCYCIESILDPQRTRGGYLEWLYKHCNTRQNQFGMTPLVDEDEPFRNHKDAAEYLASLPGVYYVEDDLVYTIQDVPFDTPLPWAYEVFGYNERRHRLVASQMEDKHTRVYQQLVGKDGYLHDHVYEQVLDRIPDGEAPFKDPVLIYTNHSTVAEAVAETFLAETEKDFIVDHAIITGDTPKKLKAELIQKFKDRKIQVLIGTATLATGTDGLDKVCDRLVILDDTEDDALRRQLIGRIMPRGSDTDASKKQVYRLIQQP